MTPGAQQIVTAYEDSGVTSLEDLCSIFSDFEPEAIKTVLLQYSTKYRRLHLASSKNKDSDNIEKPEDITDDEFEHIKQSLKNLALNCPDDNVRARTLKFLWNEKKGRNDIDKSLKGLAALNINVNMLNDHLKQIKAAKERAIIDVNDLNESRALPSPN